MADRAVVGSDYLDLLTRALTGRTVGEVTFHHEVEIGDHGSPWMRVLARLAGRRGIGLTRAQRYDPLADRVGSSGVYELPPTVLTMVGWERLDHLRRCVETIIQEQVPGDLIETGVWRGGSTILMRGALRAHEVTDRTVLVADSFQGLPPPDPTRYPADAGNHWDGHPPLAVSVDEVRANFDRFGLLDDQVEFVEGWFRDTLPPLADRQLALLRLDGDLYESTWDALSALYPALSPGGFVIIDDYYIDACRQAVDDYRQHQGLVESVEEIDWTGVYWRKGGGS